MKPESSNDLPKANTKKRKWSFSFIWVVPIVAALVAGYLVYQRVHEFGNTITIRFKNVDGLKPGQTLLQYRGVNIGEVTEIRLNDDHQSAMVKVKLQRVASSLACEGSVFWVVRPELDTGTTVGLGTIITGPHITVLPGRGRLVGEFTGAETSPMILDPDGLRITLLSARTSSMNAGVPIYYRGIEIGNVSESSLSTNATVVEIYCVIRHRFAALIRPGTKFWNVSGLDANFGLFRGAELNVESLKSLVIGGIALATPNDPASQMVQNGTTYRLYEQPEKEWLEWFPEIPIPNDDSDNQGKDRARASVTLNNNLP